MRLYLAQHGNAPTNQFGERKLSEQGKTDCENVANFAKISGIEVDFIYCSEKERAQQSAGIFAEKLGCTEKIEIKKGLLPDSDTDEWVHFANALEKSGLIIAHQPFIGKLAANLICGNVDRQFFQIYEAGLICLEKTGNLNWQLSFSLPPFLFSH